MKYVDLIQLAYPCAVYVLARLDVDAHVNDLMNCSYIQYDSIDDINRGDILVWEYHDRMYEDTVLAIDVCGPVNKEILRNKHFALYEGNGFISDIVVWQTSDIPHIRMRKLDECTIPTGFITKDAFVSHLNFKKELFKD